MEKKTEARTRLSPEVYRSLESFASFRNMSISAALRFILNEYLNDEKKTRSLTRAVSRLRSQLDQQERMILAFFQNFELFVEKFFAFAPTYPAEEMKVRKIRGEKTFELFVEEALRRNRDTGTPVFVERATAEIGEESDEE